MFFISEYEKAATLFSEAEGNWQEAQKTYGNASKKYMEAKTKYDEAAKEFNMVATTLIVLAASAAVSELVCATKMPTDTFRKKLVSAGVNVEGKHVDHIIPSAKGGADHPLNYQLWDASKNMSCGAGCLPEKFIASPPKFLMALAVSAITALNCGG